MRFSIAKSLLAKMGYQLVRTDTPVEFLPAAMMGALAASDGALRIVQIGANDGVQNDPLRGFIVSNANIRALLIEPQATPYARLAALYAEDDRVEVANVAISGERGTLRLFSLKEEYWEEYNKRSSGLNPSGFTSASHEHVVSRIGKRLGLSRDEAAARIEELVVECVPLHELVENRGFPEKFDVLQIDVEGFDAEIVESIDLDRHSPAIISYERRHLGRERHRALASLLRDAGYQCVPTGNDVCALRVEG